MKAVIISIALAVCVSGCAGVQVQRGKDISSTGVQYTAAAVALVDSAIDAVADSSSEDLTRTKLSPKQVQADCDKASEESLKALSTEEQTAERERIKAMKPAEMANYCFALLKEATAARLSLRDDADIESITLFLKLRASINTVQAYFKALQTLSEGSQAEGTGKAVESLSAQINALNAALKADGSPSKPTISSDQAVALKGLAKLVSAQVHGAKVKAALERDAERVGTSLLLIEQTIDLAEQAVSGYLKGKRSIFYADKVEKPFALQEIGAEWITDRRAYLKARASGEASAAITAARSASKLMSDGWSKLLSGEYSISEINSSLEEVRALLAAYAAVKDAEKPKAAPAK